MRVSILLPPIAREITCVQLSSPTTIIILNKFQFSQARMNFSVMSPRVITLVFSSIICLLIYLSAPSAVFAETHQVEIVRGATTMQDKAYLPNQIQILKGDTISFVNKDTVLHTATSGDGSSAVESGAFDTGFIAPNRSVEVVVNDVGDISYFCRAHPTMVGLVKVSENSVIGSGTNKATLETFHDGQIYTVTSTSAGSTRATMVAINPGVSVLVKLDNPGEVELTMPVAMIEGINSVTTVDGAAIAFTKVEETDTQTTIKINVPEGADPSVIVMGTRVVPEFPGTTMLTIGVVVAAVIFVGRSYLTGRSLLAKV